MKRVLYFGLALAALAIGGWQWHAKRAAKGAVAPLPTAEVTRGGLVVTLPVSGSLESAAETPVRSEIEGTLVDICPDNSTVKPGDFAYQLDTKDLNDQREDLARALTDAEEALATQETDGETRITQAESDLETAQEALKLAEAQTAAEREKLAAQVKFTEGETERAKRELERSQYLAEKKYIATTKLQDAERAFRRQQFALDQQRAQQADTEKKAGELLAQKQFDRDLATHTLETAKAEVASRKEDARISLAAAQRRLAEVDKKIAQCTVRIPTAGLAVLDINDNNWPERRPFRLGDQVPSGGSPMKVYDPGKMQVRCQIGEMDISYVKKGQEVWVATPTREGKRYHGKVALVEELAQESNVWQGGTPGKKVFGVLVTLEEADPTRLRPGMTVDLEIVLDRVRETTMVPIRAIFTEQGKKYVYVARGQSYVRRPVRVGTRNDLVVEVRGEVHAGERVALEAPPQEPARRGKGKT